MGLVKESIEQYCVTKELSQTLVTYLLVHPLLGKFCLVSYPVMK